MLREDQRDGEVGDPSVQDKTDKETTRLKHEAITCAVCDTELSSSEHVIVMGAHGASQAFANPYGQLREILTLSVAWNLHCDDALTSDFTWFAGYAWRISYCGNCSQHVGWRYEALQEDSRRSFYGLLLKAIRQKKSSAL